MSKKSKKRQAQAQAQKAGTASSQQVGVTATPQKAKPAETNKSSGSRTNKAPIQTDFVGRLIGAVTLKPAIYREIAHDTKGTMQAAIIVVAVAVIVGVISAFALHHTTIASVPGSVNAGTVPTIQNPIARAVVLIIQELAIWGAASWLMAAVAKGFFQGKTDTGEMLRVFGYSRIFQILLVLGVFSGVLAAVASIAGLVLSIVASVIGIRAATGFTTGRAVVVAVLGITIVVVVITFFTAFVLNPYVTTLLPT